MKFKIHLGFSINFVIMLITKSKLPSPQDTLSSSRVIQLHWALILPTTLHFTIYCKVKTSQLFTSDDWWWLMIDYQWLNLISNPDFLSVRFPSAIRLRENLCATGLFEEGVFSCCCRKAMGFMSRLHFVTFAPIPFLCQSVQVDTGGWCSSRRHRFSLGSWQLVGTFPQ